MPSSHLKKRIVFVLSGYGRYARGAERLISQLVTGLSEAFDVSVLCSVDSAPSSVALSFVGRENRLTNAINRTPVLGHICRSMQIDPLNWEWATCAWSARKWLLNNPCDLLIPEGGRWAGWLGHWYRKRTGTPFVDIAQGAPSRWEVSAARWLPDRYIALTNTSADEMRRRVPSLNVQVIHPGVDTNTFSPGAAGRSYGLTSPVVVAVGALEPLKRMDAVIEAVHLWGKGSLLLVGDGPQREALTELGNRRLGPERFCQLSAKPEDMPDIYRSADLMVSASKSEAFGLVYLEALATGLPVVTQDDAVRREIVGNAGVFCNAGEASKLAAGMEKALRAVARDTARSRALQFDQRLVIDQFRDLFSSLLGLRA